MLERIRNSENVEQEIRTASRETPPAKNEA